MKPCIRWDLLLLGKFTHPFNFTLQELILIDQSSDFLLQLGLFVSKAFSLRLEDFDLALILVDSHTQALQLDITLSLPTLK